jgi:hypothetical protein
LVTSLNVTALSTVPPRLRSITLSCGLSAI